MEHYTFVYGLVSGYIGAICVYPIDLIKTRMQNQTTQKLYKNGLDCFLQIVRADGYRSMYRGSFTQLVGIGPEKAIKISMNSFVEKRLDNNPVSKIIAGACAGASQVSVTNPIEVVKIQYQMSPPGSRHLISTIKQIGGLGALYRGASLCFMRDIPFSAIYFPCYGHLKKLTHEHQMQEKTSYFVSGTLAGVPAAYLVTPADVVKTRVQTNLGKGTGPASVVAVASRIYQEEGFRAFWKGGMWRVYKSAPQFGITLLVYEILKDLAIQPTPVLAKI